MDPLTDAHLLDLNRSATVARLLAGVAHEVNNALLVIGGTAELLEDQTDSPESLGKGLARIRAQTMKAAAALTDVLAFTRGSAGDRGRVNLRDIAAASIALRAYAIGRARLSVALAPDDVNAANAANGQFIVQGSRVLLQQAVLNLIANAEQALAQTPGGAIRLSLAHADGRVRLRVEDTGAGVPAADRQRIFEPFVSGVGDSSAGLGLPAARRIAEMHGGTLTLDEASAGAAFVLELPAA